MIKIRLTLSLLIGLLTGTTQAQVDQERFEAAKRRLEEKRRASTQPSPTSRSSIDDTPAPEEVAPGGARIWRATPQAPAAIRRWLDEAPQRLEARAVQLQSELARERAVLADEAAKLKRVHRRRLQQISFKGSLGQWHTKDSPRDVARRRAEVKAQQRVVNAQRARIAGIEKQLEEGQFGAMELVLLTFEDTDGSFGFLTSAVRVQHVIDATNCIVIYGGTTYWLEGSETSTFTPNAQVELDAPVILLPERRVMPPGSRRRVPVLRSFSWADYAEAVDVSEALASGSTRGAAVGGDPVPAATQPRKRLGPLGERLDEPAPTSAPAAESPAASADVAGAPGGPELRPDAALGRLTAPDRAATTRPASGSGAAAAKPPGRIIYIIDASGSMIDKFTGVRDVVFEAIANLPAAVSFNVLAVGDEKVKSFQPRPVQASPATVGEAKAFFNDLTTNGTSDLLPAVEMAVRQRATVVWLVTDGDVPNGPEFLSRLNRANVGRRTRINTVVAGYSPKARDDVDDAFVHFLTQVAAEHGGECYDMDGNVLGFVALPAVPAVGAPGARRGGAAAPANPDGRPQAPDCERVFDLDE
jgi:hypothetical protein